jgi:hypothetical protein
LLHNRVLSFLMTQPRLRGTASVYLRHAEGAQNSTQILEWSVMAAKEATERFAYPEALAHYERALQIEIEPSKGFKFLLAQCRIYSIQGQRDPWSECIEKLLWQAAETQDPELEVSAMLAEIDMLLERGDHHEVLEHVDLLLRRPSLTGNQRADALVSAARAFSSLERIIEAEKYLLEAEPLMAPENHQLHARLNVELRATAIKRKDLTEARYRNALALEAWRKSGNRSGEIEARFNTGLLSEKADDLDIAYVAYQNALERAHELGDIPFQRHGAFLLANLKLKQLDDQGARPWVEHGMQLSIEPPNVMYEGIFHEQQAYIHSFQGELGLMVERGTRALHCYQRLSFATYQAEQHEWLAHRLIELGQYAAAYEHIEQGQSLAMQEQLIEQTTCFQLVRARHHLENKKLDQAFEAIDTVFHATEKSVVSSRAFPTAVVIGQILLAHGMLEQAATALRVREDYPPDETFRLATLLRVQNKQGMVQETDLEAAQSLLLLNVPPSYALELRLALANALQSKGFVHQSKSTLKKVPKIQQFLISSLQLEHRDGYLRRISQIQNQEVGVI